MKHYIIMADIINSSQKNGKALMDHFKQMVKEVNTLYAADITSPLTITLGDEFQGVVADLAIAIAVVFTMDEMTLTANPEYRLRFVINYGEIDTVINEKNAYEMLGEGLTKSRQRLSAIKSENSEIWVDGVAQSEQLNMAFKLYRSFYNDWKRSDRPIAASFLKVEDYKEVARLHHKDPSTMWRRERSLKMDEFKTSRALIKNLAG